MADYRDPYELLAEAAELLRSVPDDADTTDRIVEWERQRGDFVRRAEAAIESNTDGWVWASENG